MHSVVLYTTQACHLCELAREQIEASACYEAVVLTEVDINQDRELIRLYGTRVPVVYSETLPAPLAWPFDAVDFCQWLQA
ncbi:MAG: glutaredoxin family protein [Cellvibrionaceae bacterium]|nr:glutaredoxin family protein [Cellvibrionaceae bacterium]